MKEHHDFFFPLNTVYKSSTTIHTHFTVRLVSLSQIASEGHRAAAVLSCTVCVVSDLSEWQEHLRSSCCHSTTTEVNKSPAQTIYSAALINHSQTSCKQQQCYLFITSKYSYCASLLYNRPKNNSTPKEQYVRNAQYSKNSS